MNATDGMLLVQLPVMMVVASVVTMVALRRNGGTLPLLTVNGSMRPRARIAGMAALAGLWLALTVVTMWCAFLGGFVAVHLLLFWVGRAAAALGLIVLAVVLVSIPFVWGWAILRTAVH
ncbi:MAG TPA: hypothetical protein VFT91_08830 [Dehalococcoidia bacterium]|nr:hypothetical protein [Dehalococcoidia bacterium]